MTPSSSDSMKNKNWKNSYQKTLSFHQDHYGDKRRDETVCRSSSTPSGQ